MEISIRQLAEQMKDLQERFDTHRHEYINFHLPANVWVDFRQIREIVGSQSHHMDKWGQYFAASAVTGEEDRSDLTTKPRY